MQSPIHVTVLFDRQCSVCRVLAQVVADESPSNWTFLPWQQYQVPPSAPKAWNEIIPRELRIVAENHYFEGEAAWQYLLQHNPRLQKYQLLAAKVGLSAPQSARWLQAVGHGLRRLCISCVYFRR